MSTYTVITGEPTSEQYEASSNSASTARRSLDQAQVLLEWSGDTPDCMAALTIYTHAEILVLMQGPEWTEPHE
jgi:hypothetical protein